MYVRNAFIQRNHLHDWTILTEQQGKSIWNEDMMAIFRGEMHGHNRGRQHSRYRAWARVALGDVNTAKQILAEGMAADVFQYICQLLPTAWRYQNAA